MRLDRQAADAGKPEVVVDDPGAVQSFSIGNGAVVAYALSTPQDTAQLFLRTGAGPAQKLTNLNADLLRGVDIAPVEAFTFISNDNKWEVEAFLTKPLPM